MVASGATMTMGWALVEGFGEEGEELLPVLFSRLFVVDGEVGHGPAVGGAGVGFAFVGDAGFGEGGFQAAGHFGGIGVVVFGGGDVEAGAHGGGQEVGA